MKTSDFLFEEEQGIAIFTVSGDLVIGNNKGVADKVDEEIKNGRELFLFDVREIDFMDSTTLGIFSKILKSDCTLKFIIDEENTGIIELIELIIVNFEKTGFFTDRKRAVNNLINP